MGTLERKIQTMKGERFDLTTRRNHPRISFPFPEFTPPEQVVSMNNGQTWSDLIELYARRNGCNPDQIEVNKRIKLPSRDSVCYVTTLLYEKDGNWVISNSLAGSNAPQPYYWDLDPSIPKFHTYQYTGLAKVLDLREYFSGNGDRSITVEMLKSAAGDQDVNLEFQLANPGKAVRIILRTYDRVPLKWDPDYAYLHPEAAEFLGGLPNLVLIATDVPSLDKVDNAGVSGYAYKSLWNGRVAILRGVNSNALPNEQGLSGFIKTDLVRISDAKEAKFAEVSFYPVQEKDI